jgi:hypothetical protein
MQKRTLDVFDATHFDLRVHPGAGQLPINVQYRWESLSGRWTHTSRCPRDSNGPFLLQLHLWIRVLTFFPIDDKYNRIVNVFKFSLETHMT